jgi:hypothetical protein
MLVLVLVLLVVVVLLLLLLLLIESLLCGVCGAGVVCVWRGSETLSKRLDARAVDCARSRL